MTGKLNISIVNEIELDHEKSLESDNILYFIGLSGDFKKIFSDCYTITR